MNNLGGIEVTVNQKPISVSFVCPVCDHENEFEYGEFCDMCGEPPDWSFEIVQCEDCRAKFTISSQDWQ